MTRKSVLAVVALLLFAPLQASPHLASRSATGETLPPDILPVVFLQGSDYDMGVQYGQQAGPYIMKVIESYWAEALQRFPRSDVITALKANHHYIVRYAPETPEIFRGIVDGMNASGHHVTYEDIVLINSTLPKPETSTLPQGMDKEVFPPKKCSVSSAWGSATKNGKLVGLDTLDGGEAFYGVLVVAYPDKGNNYMTGAQAGTIGSHFLMNSRGLFIGNSGGGDSPRDIDQNYGISWFTGLPHMARFANSAEEARQMITSWQIDIPENFHLVDVKGGAFVVEKTSAVQAVRKAGDFGERDFLFSTNNYLAEPMKVTKTGDFIKGHGGYGAYSAPRNKVFWDMLHNYHGAIDEEFMKMILRFPGDSVPPPEGGWDATICRPSNSWVSVVVPDDGDKGYAHICTGPAGRVIHSSAMEGGGVMRSNYLFIDGTHTFFKMNLAGSPKDAAVAAERTARVDIAAAYGRLMRLNHKDPGYTPLFRMYNDTLREYFEGKAHLNKALMVQGRAGLLEMSRAATCFTRAQAHAHEVYDALVPPPTSPADLGLKPFGGDWAQWETRVGRSK